MKKQEYSNWGVRETFWLGVTVFCIVFFLDSIVVKVLESYQTSNAFESYGQSSDNVTTSKLTVGFNFIMYSLFFHSVFMISLLFSLARCKSKTNLLLYYNLGKQPRVADVTKYTFLLVSYILITHYVLSLFEVPQKEIFLADEDIANNIIISFFVIVIIVPFTEELFFRGFLYQGWVSSVRNKYFGNISISILFTLAHTSSYAFIDLFFIFILSLLLGYVRQQSNSLWLPIYIHAFNNALFLISTFVNVRL